MKKPKAEELMTIISMIDSNSVVRFSDSTNKFYVSTGIEIKEGNTWHSPSEHKPTITEAIMAYYKRLQGNVLLCNNTEQKVPTLLDDRGETYEDALLDRVLSFDIEYNIAAKYVWTMIKNSMYKEGLFHAIHDKWSDVLPKNSKIFDISFDILQIEWLKDIYEENGNKGDNNKNIITICGSTRFKDVIDLISGQLELEGKIVLPVICLPNPETLSHVQRDVLSNLHRKKIDMSGGIFVVDVNEYVGESVESEIQYARSKNKDILYLSDFIKNFDSLLRGINK